MRMFKSSVLFTDAMYLTIMSTKNKKSRKGILMPYYQCYWLHLAGIRQNNLQNCAEDTLSTESVPTFCLHWITKYVITNSTLVFCTMVLLLEYSERIPTLHFYWVFDRRHLYTSWIIFQNKSFKLFARSSALLKFGLYYICSWVVWIPANK